MTFIEIKVPIQKIGKHNIKTAGNNGLGDWCGSTQSMGGGGGSHNHTLNSHTHTKAISIAQPWIACYIWRRSA